MYLPCPQITQNPRQRADEIQLKKRGQAGVSVAAPARPPAPPGLHRERGGSPVLPSSISPEASQLPGERGR